MRGEGKFRILFVYGFAKRVGRGKEGGAPQQNSETEEGWNALMF